MNGDSKADSVVPMAPDCSRLLGHARSVRFLMDLREIAARLGKAGPVVRVKAGPFVGYLLNDSSLIRQAARDEDTFMFWGREPHVRVIVREGLLSTEGTVHRDRRAVMRPAFAVPRPADLGASVRTETRSLLATLPADRPVDMSHEMTRLTFHLAVRCVLRSEVSPGTLTALAAAHATLSQVGALRFLLSPWPWVPVPRQRALRRALAVLDEATREVLARHRPAEDGCDVVSLLKQAWREPSEAAVQDVRTLLFTGGEATASTLAWACYELGRHPHHQQALQEEADAALGPGQSQAGFGMDRLPRTAAFVKEVIRLHGLPVLVRCTRRETWLGGHRLPAKATVFLHLGAMSRDPAHFERPDVFDPTRWMPDAQPSVSPAAWLPYALGPRYCPGAAVADVMVPVALATLVATRTVRTARPGRTVRSGFELAAMPRGLTMTAALREPCPSSPSAASGRRPHEGASSIARP